MNLLIVDDDTSLSSLISFNLKPLFTNILESSSKQDALQQIQNYDFEIALVDLSLDEPYDGVELAKTFVQKGIKTIIFTANRSQSVIKELIQFGVFDYISKPIAVDLLIESIKRAILFKENEEQMAKEAIFSLNVNVDLKDGIKNSLAGVEKKLIQEVLTQYDYNIYKIAKLLNMKRENIYYFMKKYNIKRQD